MKSISRRGPPDLSFSRTHLHDQVVSRPQCRSSSSSARTSRQVFSRRALSRLLKSLRTCGCGQVGSTISNDGSLKEDAFLRLWVVRWSRCPRGRSPEAKARETPSSCTDHFKPFWLSATATLDCHLQTEESAVTVGVHIQRLVLRRRCRWSVRIQ